MVQRKGSDLESVMGATVVVPTRDRDEYVARLLTDLVNQTYRPLEILVVDQSDSESPLLNDVAEQYSCLVKIHRASFRNVGIARNWGLYAAQYESVIFIDDDMRCNDDFVSLHMETLGETGVGMVAGAIDESYDEGQVNENLVGKYSRWTAKAYRGFSSHSCRDIDHVPGANCSVWKKVALAAGGYDEVLSIPPGLYEETELPIRIQSLGYRIRFCGEARALHLSAAHGGNRELDPAKYVYSLSHNRSIMIRRYSSWYQYATALFYSLKLILAYTLSYKSWKTLHQGVRGALLGWIQGAKPRVYSDFAREV